ncbi:NYN domain-containing protein [Solimonas sp. SE-A11]|uniref:LabA-like NYN domain-containing protein n=1 Tax=Solimonas sp. SE-A11 TaxID=3054954 RepID=UPI00259D1504|nr:NYN domain-containing protein [Solimonas sp. SE-A11]
MSTTAPSKVAIFADVQNVYYTTRQAHGRHFDYNAFWAAATQGRQVFKALAYAIDRGDAKQRQFQNILRGIGFDVQLKPYIQRADGSSKGDWDVGIAIDVMDHAASVDVVVLVSGDGDFSLLVDRVRQKYGVTVEVYGVEALTAQALVRSASSFVPIGNTLLLRG